MSRPLTAFSALLLAGMLAGCSLEDAPLIGKPAASVDGHTISMSDYRQRLKVEQDFYKQTRTEAQKEDIAVRSLVDEQLIADEAQKKGFTVTDDEINKEIAHQRSTYERFSALERAQNPTQPAPPDFNTFLRREGYDVDRLRESVRLILLEQKVEHKQAQNRADTAYREIQGGLDLMEAAKKYSDGPRASTGGETTASSLDLASGDPRLMPALNTLQAGDTSKVLEGVNGFYIFKLLTRTDTGITADVVFIQAPAQSQYSPKLRPAWFTAFVKGLENNAHVKYNVGPRAT
ncbi:MAG: SurA N-terminal domain-containing protein [Candidatus Dormibacteraeota bacterium]|nr:SurA N-terminal domain-containing protein [Candidatus Dormibacteraeota bacterium]